MHVEYSVLQRSEIKGNRTFVHGKDIAWGLKLITRYYAEADPVNVGHNCEITIRKLFTRILRITSKHSRAVLETSKPEGANRKSADFMKLREITHGFTPQIKPDEGLEEMIRYFQQTFFRGKIPVR